MSRSVNEGRKLPDSLRGPQLEKDCQTKAGDSSDVASGETRENIDDGSGAGEKTGVEARSTEWLSKWSDLADVAFVTTLALVLIWSMAALIIVVHFFGGIRVLRIEMRIALRSCTSNLTVQVALGISTVILFLSIAWLKRLNKIKKRYGPFERFSVAWKNHFIAISFISLASVMILASLLGSVFFVLFFITLILGVGLITVLIEVMDYSKAETEAACKEVVFHSLSLISIFIAIIFAELAYFPARAWLT